MTDLFQISVIVPVFNGEKYLTKCLDSIRSQTFSNFEIICIDDGSSDSTPEILSEYALKDPRIRIISQENRGAGMARNTGMDASAGKYLVFWDSDDWFDPEALEKMYLKSEQCGADICVCSGTTYLEEAEKEIPSAVYLRRSAIPENDPFNITDIPDHILDFTVSTLWNKMFRKSFLEDNGLSFGGYKTGEDANFVVRALCLAEKITTVDERLICYRSYQEQSLSMQWFDGRTPIEAWCDTADYLKEHGIMPERSFANKAWSSMLGLLRKAASVWDVFSRVVNTLKSGALERMCVTEREEGFYYEQWKADCLHHFLNDSAEDFLCYYLKTTFVQLRQASGQYRSAVLKISDMRADAASLKEKINVLRNKNESLEMKRSRLSERLESAQEKIGILKDRNAELKEIKKELSGKVNQSEKRIEKLNARNEASKQKNDELREMLSASRERRAHLQERNETLKTEKKEIAARLRASERHNEKLIARNGALKTRQIEQTELLKERKAALNKSVKRNQILVQQNRALKNSMSYRIGRIITWLPRKIAGLFRKKQK